LKKSPTGPAFTKDPLKNKSAITSNNKVFIADNSMIRLVCVRWTSETQRKEIFPAHNETLSVVRDARQIQIVRD